MNTEEIMLDRDMLKQELKLIKCRLREITGVDSDDTEELISAVARLRSIRTRLHNSILIIQSLESELDGTRSQLESYKKLAEDRFIENLEKYENLEDV